MGGCSSCISKTSSELGRRISRVDVVFGYVEREFFFFFGRLGVYLVFSFQK